MTEREKVIPPLSMWQRRFWSQRSDYARLERELWAFGIEFEMLKARAAVAAPASSGTGDRKAEDNPGPQTDVGHTIPRHAWTKAADDAAGAARDHLIEKRNIEGGWMSLHAARRHAIFGLSRQELLIQASMLRAEAPKIGLWRGAEMARLLNEDRSPVSAHQVVAAMALRDEYFSNQYHKVWLVGGQITILLTCCGLGFLFFLPLVVCSTRQVPATLMPWGYQMVGAVLFFGLLGAAFSAAGSLMSANATAKIPERVANQFVTIARALFGSGIALAGYAFYQSKALNFHLGDDVLPGGALGTAFLFGFGGEVLIARVLGALGASQDKPK